MLNSFVCASNDRGTLQQPIPAPLFRKEFWIEQPLSSAKLRICGLGLYRVFINGKDITKGFFAPYISNTDDIVYVDEYDITDHLRHGENSLCAILGNGFQNALGGSIWDLDKATFQSVPKLAFSLELCYPNGKRQHIQSDTQVLTASSPITFNDWWCGEYCDAREAFDWTNPTSQKNDPRWVPSLPAAKPLGQQRCSGALPIRVHQTRKPVSITPVKGGYLYDFGINDAGSFTLNIHKPTCGQEIRLSLGEYWDGSQFNSKKLYFVPEGLGQVDRYICRGEEKETWQPMFVYHGYRYILVEGITEAQATEDLLTYLVIHSDLPQRGQFHCDDPILEKIHEITCRALLCNFYFYPTDCPQREKHGWTDAGQWADAVMLNWAPERSYREWMVNVRAAQSPEGMFPGIVPIGDWGMNLGGPYWDAVIVNLPWVIWKYRGDLSYFQENEDAVIRYIRYLSRIRNERGLISFGIGDWCPVGKIEPRDFKSPIVVTDTAISYDICSKAAKLFAAAGNDAASSESQKLADELRSSARAHLIDWNTLTVDGNCQTSQAAFLYYRIFDRSEWTAAANVLVDIIKRDDMLMDVGCIGGRVLFHVLSEAGESALAYHMITRPEFPSFRNWLDRGATTLWEDFQEKEADVCSRNHPMWGDISNWMYQWVAGLQINPFHRDCNEVSIRPGFAIGISQAEAWHETPAGRVHIRWTQENTHRLLHISFTKEHTILLYPDGTSKNPPIIIRNTHGSREFDFNGIHYALHVTCHNTSNHHL